MRLISMTLIAWIISSQVQAQPGHAGGGRDQVSREELERQAKEIFTTRCNTCHRWDREKGDANKAFGKDGLPINPKRMLETIDLAVDTDGHMPPDGAKQLTDQQKATLHAWVKAAAPKGTPAAPNTKCTEIPTPSLINPILPGVRPMDRKQEALFRQFNQGKTREEVRKEALLDYKERNIAKNTIITDIEAGKIMKQACYGCHGVPTVKSSLNPARTIFQKMHTPLVNSDGTLYAGSFGGKEKEHKTTLGRLYAQIVGVDGASFMPPAKLPPMPPGTSVVYKKQDLEQLAEWISAQKANDLPDRCEVMAYKQGATMNFGAAVAACGQLGFRIPSIGQLERMGDQARALTGGQGCVWSSGFSQNAAMPRAVLGFTANGTSRQPATFDTACKVLCFRH